jgi:hypothetical protein
LVEINSVCKKFFPKNNIYGVKVSRDINIKNILVEAIFI